MDELRQVWEEMRVLKEQIVQMQGLMQQADVAGNLQVHVQPNTSGTVNTSTPEPTDEV